MRVAVLGGGISGLGAAYYAQKQGHEVVLFEKEDRVGGWLGSSDKEGYHFEKGPRTFAISRSSALLHLIDDLGLTPKLIHSSKKGAARYLYYENSLHTFPLLLFRFFPQIIREWSVPPKREDETIYDFAARRFGKEMAEIVFDALALGIFAGDIHTLSVQNCLPFLKKLEREYGSVVKGMAKSPKTKKSEGLFTLEGGTQTLIDALSTHFPIRLQTPITSLEEKRVNGIAFDRVVSCLPPWALAALIPGIAPLLGQIEMKDLYVISVGYAKDVLQKKGFGYLIPTREGKQIYGCIFDSCIFPQQNSRPGQTRLTVMAKGKEIMEELAGQIGVPKKPDYLHVMHCKKAIPQYCLGHEMLIDQIKQKLPSWLTIHGNYVAGASVNSCVTSQPFKDWTSSPSKSGV